MDHPAKRRRLNQKKKIPSEANFVKLVLDPNVKREVFTTLAQLFDLDTTMKDGGLRRVLSMPRRTLNSESIETLQQNTWWVTEKSAHPWFWWLLMPTRKSYFIDQQMDVYITTESEDFCGLFAGKEPTLLEGNLVPQMVNGRRHGFEFLVNDVLVWKRTIMITSPLGHRLKMIGTHLVLPFRQNERRYRFPFKIRGKFTVPLANVGKIIGGQRFSQSAGLWMFRDEKQRENRTEGLVFRHDNHFWSLEDSHNKCLVWHYPPTFVASLFSPFVENDKLQVHLRCNIDGRYSEIPAMTSGISSESYKMVSRSQCHQLRAQMFYDADSSRFEILKILPATSETDTLEHTLKVMQSQMGTIPIGKVKRACLDVINTQGKQNKRKRQHRE